MTDTPKRRGPNFEDIGALFDRWGWSEDAPPHPGRIADRLSDIVGQLRDHESTTADPALAAIVDDIDSLRASLDAFSSLPLHKGLPDA